MNPTNMHDVDTINQMILGSFFIMGMVVGGVISVLFSKSEKRKDRKE